MSDIEKHVKKLIETNEKIQLNVPYIKFMGTNEENYNYIEKAIEFYGKPIAIIPRVAYFEVDASEFYEVIDKGCPCCGKDKFKFIGWLPAKFNNNPNYAVIPGAYDIFGVLPKMGCRNCYLYIGVNESMCSEDDIFEYHINDRVRLKNGMEASITEVLDADRFVADIDYPVDRKIENINREDVEHILRRYK